MIPKKHRLSSAQIRQAMQARKGFVCGGIRVKYLPAPDGVGRLGVVVSRKKTGTAVVRNKVRRRFYESLRPIIELPFWVVVFVQKINMTTKEREQALSCIQKNLTPPGENETNN